MNLIESQIRLEGRGPGEGGEEEGGGETVAREPAGEPGLRPRRRHFYVCGRGTGMD